MNAIFINAKIYLKRSVLLILYTNITYQKHADVDFGMSYYLFLTYCNYTFSLVHQPIFTSCKHIKFTNIMPDLLFIDKYYIYIECYSVVTIHRYTGLEIDFVYFLNMHLQSCCLKFRVWGENGVFMCKSLHTRNAFWN